MVPGGEAEGGRRIKCQSRTLSPPPPSPPLSSSASVGIRAQCFGLCPLHPIYKSGTELGHIRELLSEGKRAGRIQTQVSYLENSAELPQKPSVPAHGLSNNSRESWGWQPCALSA